MKVSIFLCFLLTAFYVVEEAEAAEKKFMVVIDPGHGGKDPGAVGNKYKEKDINLAVALQVGALLEKEKDVLVTYTRKTDVFIPLDERPRMANKMKADLFISIHTNALNNKTTQGAETYVIGSSAANMDIAMRENAAILFEEDYKTRYEGFDPNSTESYIMFDFMQFAFMDQSLKLASFVQDQFRNSCNRSDRGVRQASFLVLRQTNMPSILVELGYISNPQEAAYLVEEKSHKELAQAIYKAFLEYKADYEKKNSSATFDNRKKNETQPNNKEVQKQGENANKETSEPKQSNERTDVAPEVSYWVQFYISDKQKPLDSRTFKNFVPAKEYFENKVYKYMYGETFSYKDAKKVRKEVQKQFPDAFIVVFKNDKKLPLKEAEKYFK